jgi:hypothetical protein
VRFKGRLFDGMRSAARRNAPTAHARVTVPPHGADAPPSMETLEADLAVAQLDRRVPPAVLAVVADLMARLVAADAEAGRP